MYSPFMYFVFILYGRTCLKLVKKEVKQVPEGKIKRNYMVLIHMAIGVGVIYGLSIGLWPVMLLGWLMATQLWKAVEKKEVKFLYIKILGCIMAEAIISAVLLKYHKEIIITIVLITVIAFITMWFASLKHPSVPLHHGTFKRVICVCVMVLMILLIDRSGSKIHIEYEAIDNQVNIELSVKDKATAIQSYGWDWSNNILFTSKSKKAESVMQNYDAKSYKEDSIEIEGRIIRIYDKDDRGLVTSQIRYVPTFYYYGE